MPRSIASASSGWHIIGSTTATRGLTAKPAGTHRAEAMIARYSATHSAASSGSTNEKLRAPIAFSAASRIVSRRAQATPRGGARLLQRLGDHVALGHRDKAALHAGERLLYEHPRDGVERLLPLLPFGGAVDAEALELGAARGLAGPELDPPVGDQVERGDGLGDTRGMLVSRRQRQDAEAEPDACRALRRGGEEDVRGARVRVLLEEVVLDLPHGVKADAVGDLDLLERVVQQPVLAVLAPRARQLVLVEDPEPHRANASRPRRRRGRELERPRSAGPLRSKPVSRILS